MIKLSLSELNSFNDDQEFKINRKQLEGLGGISAVVQKLDASTLDGLNDDLRQIEKRRELFGSNEFPEPESNTWFGLFFESFEDTTLIVLIVAAVVSLIVGIYENPATGWIEGSAILFAVVLVAVVTATNNFSKESQFRKLNAVKDDITVGATRSKRRILLPVKELIVGDLVHLSAGDRVPADGILVNGSDVRCNESAITGEPDPLKKTVEADCFLISGASLTSGNCSMLVTAVGENSRWGRTKAKLAIESPDTPLQEKLDDLANQIGYLGMACAGATFVAMMVVWFMYPEGREKDVTVFDHMLKAFIMAVTIVVVAVPEGLPLAVTLSLAFSSQKMMADNNLIRHLEACETMGNATNICSDKTGTLTQNRMTVVQGWVAETFYSDNPPSETILSMQVVKYLKENISINSTTVLIKKGNEIIVNGNSTEAALLSMIEDKFAADFMQLRCQFNAADGDKLYTFSSARKSMSVFIANGKVLYCKGAAEIIVEKCKYFTASDGSKKVIDATTKAKINQAIQQMASGALRTVALGHKTLDFTPADDSEPETLEVEMTLDGIYGIKDPLRPDVIEAVKKCQSAGIFVRMVTGDNLETAKAIAKECGILTEGGTCLEGPEFRKLTPAQLDEYLPTLQVLARSSPDDKHTLVTRLNGHALPKDEAAWRELHPECDWNTQRDTVLPGYAEEWENRRGDRGGEVVGVTGDGTNDGPALKAADVGLSMGLTGTNVAKEASDIVIMDDNFASIVKAVMWGRSVFDNIRKFLQFQLTVNVVALTLTFMSAVTGREPPLNAVMMLWVNLIMDTMGALALGTEPPSVLLLERRPYKRNASLISNKMLRNITVQFLFQFSLLVYLLMYGASDFETIDGSRQHVVVIFNTFVFCQVFNELNARSIGDDCNIFKGLFKNPMFVAILLFTVLMQYGLVEFGGEFVRTTSLTQEQWIKCILLGSLSLPLGGLMRLIPIDDKKSDFADVSELIATSPSAQAASTKKEGVSPSFFVWVVVVTVIPLMVVSHFGSSWAIHVEHLKGLFL